MGEHEDAEVFDARRASFGAYAATYEAVRPEWPTQTVAWMLGSPTTAATVTTTTTTTTTTTARRVVDLGAGTGKGTRAIAALGHQVIAVEPSDGMREALTASLAALPAEVAGRISTLAGGAEDIPVETSSVDAVTAFQAWHWFDGTAAAAECARVLRPGGWLSMGWHHRCEDVGWSRELSEIIQTRANEPADKETPPGPPSAQEFEPFEAELFTYGMRQSVEDFVLHASTWSYVAVHPQRERILDDVRALVRRVADVEGMVEIPMTTRCYRLRRR
jgi:SAM-dependent methyltransferase